MKQEYLISIATEKEAISTHTFEQKPDIRTELKIVFHIETIFNTEAWVVSYSTISNSEDAAKILSEVDEWIRNNSHVIVLTNESSAYYNKTLFPLINDFERGLRKLLYLMFAKHKDDSSVQYIKDIENKDLGQIFEFLFSDREFSNNVRQLVNDKSWIFTKNEVINNISKIDEVTRWDTLLGKDVVPSLRNHFYVVKDDRNHIMHAHNIGYREFLKMKKLFTQINDEIGQAIDKILGKTSSEAQNFDYPISTAWEAYVKTIEDMPSLQQYKDSLTAMNIVLNSSIMQQMEEFKKLKDYIQDKYDKKIDSSDEDDRSDKKDDTNETDIEDDTNENDKEDDPNVPQSK